MAAKSNPAAYKRLRRAVKKPGIQAVERRAIQAVQKNRDVDRQRARRIVTKRVAQGKGVGGSNSPFSNRLGKPVGDKRDLPRKPTGPFDPDHPIPLPPSKGSPGNPDNPQPKPPKKPNQTMVTNRATGGRRVGRDVRGRRPGQGRVMKLPRQPAPNIPNRA